MTIQRRPRPQWRKRAAALAAGGLVLYLVAATAASPTAASAWEAVSRRGDVALRLLQSQLAGGWNASGLPVEAALVIGQSPVLRSNQDAVRNLLRTEEDDDSGLPEEPAEDAVLPGEPAPPAAPVTEEPAETELPLVFADNGVTARTLVPSTPSGYVVTGDVYIDNRTDQELDAGIFDETFAAALSEEEGPQVLIVHTHGSEAYTMPPGQEYEPSGDCRTTDCNYNVVRVGDELARVLEETGICVLHDPTLHDYPEYSGAYGRSLDAVEKAMAEHPSISIVLDVHRDAISDGDGNPYKVISNVAGLNIAQMSMVIGTDGGGLDHPEWRENLKLAAAVQQKLADSYPTLMRPITVRNSRYNQHVTPGALLVEMGAAGNSLDEALVSARLFGAALAETLKGK
ncbi:MAG: stage II sporulation protein P [Oscillospiraceae bacterium]|jgi:stage II sporulation protein P|nr:stage II sporulation protein P [Oscillospiraceae bacterium]MDE6996391.1 stage II sporulation protein P [Oscillospiraceae bacterium]